MTCVTSAWLSVPSITYTWRVLHATPYTKRSLLQTQVEPEIHPSHIGVDGRTFILRRLGWGHAQEKRRLGDNRLTTVVLVYAASTCSASTYYWLWCTSIV